MDTQSGNSPLSKSCFSLKVEEETTDFFMTGFSDRILVVATQTGTLGTVVEAK